MKRYIVRWRYRDNPVDRAKMLAVEESSVSGLLDFMTLAFPERKVIAVYERVWSATESEVTENA